MSLQKATELKEENITATKLKKKAGSKANPTVKARKQESSMVNADKVVKTKRTSRKESAKATTPDVDSNSQAIQGDLLANLTGDDLLLANNETSKATKSASLSAKIDSSKDTHKDETTKVPSPLAVAASASVSASISAGAKAKANAKEKAPAKANARANANANANAEAETKTEAKSEVAAKVGTEAAGVKAQQRKSKNTKAAPEAKLKASASHKKDEINEESLWDKDLAQSNAKEVVKTKRPASKRSKDRQQAKNKQDVSLASTAETQTAVPMTATNSTDISDASSVLTSAASSAVGGAGAGAGAGANAAADNGKSKGKGLDKGKAGMAAVGGQSVLDELGMGRLQDALHLQEDQEHAKESKAHTLPKSRKRVIGEIVSRKDSNEVPVNAQIGLIVNRVNSYSSKEFHVNLQISKQLPWLERSLNMVTFSPEQRAIVTSEERFLVVDSVVGAKSVALVVERAVYLYTKLKQQEKHKRVKVLICHGLSSLEGSYLQALQEHMAVLELSDFVICDLNNLPCNPKEFDIVLIDDAQVMLQWKLYALTTNYQFAYCTIFVDGSKLEAFALRRCQQPYEDILAQGYLPIYSDLELQVLSYAKARANYPFYQYQLAHKKAAKSLKQIGQEYLAPDSTVMIDEALGYLECFYPKAQIDEIINNLYYVLEQKNIASQEKGKDQRPALAGDLNSLEQVKQWLDPKSQERILQESYERSVNWGMYPLGVWHERYHGQGHTLFSSNLDSGLKALSLVYPQQWRLESLNLQFNYLSSQFALDKDTLSGIIPLLSSSSLSSSLSSSPMDEAPQVYEQQYHQAQVSVQDIDAPMGNDKGYGEDMGLNHGSYAVQDMGSNNKTGDDATTVLGKRGPRPFSYVELLLKMGFKRRKVDNYNFDQGELFDLPKLCALSLQMDIPVFKSFALGYGSMQVYLNRRFGFELNKHEAKGYRSFKANRIFSSFVQKFEDLWLTEYEKLKVEREMRAQSLMSLRLLSLNYQTSPLVLSSCYKFTSLWTKQHDISSRLAPNHEESQFQVIDQNLRIDMLCYAQALKNQAQSQHTSPINSAINSSGQVDSAVNSQDIYQDAIAQALSFNALSSFDSYKLQALCLLSMGKISTNSLSQIFSRTLKACNSSSQASSDASTAVPEATVDHASTASTASAAQIRASTVKSDDITSTGTGNGSGTSTVSGADADAITGTDSNKLLATLEQQLMSYFLQRGISLGELSTLLIWEQLHQTVLAQQVILGQSLHWEPQLGTQKLIMGNSLEQVDKLLDVVPVPEMTASKAQVATDTKTGAIAGASSSAGAGDSFGGSFVSRACAQLKLNSPELLKKVECALAELMACRLGKVWHSAHYVQLQPSVLTRPQDSDLARGSLSLIQYAPALQQVLSQEPSFKLEANVTTRATSTCDAASQLVSEVNREFSASQSELNNLDCSFSMVAGYYAYQALDAFDENMQQHYSFAANYGHIFNSAVIHKIKGQNLTHKLSDHEVTKETYPAEQNLVLGGSWLEQQPNTNGSTNTSNAAMATALDLASATAMPMALVSARDAAVVLASARDLDAAAIAAADANANANVNAAAAGAGAGAEAQAALKYFLHTYGSQWGYEMGAYEQDWHLSAKEIKQLSNQERYLLTLSSYVLNQEQGLKGQSKDASAKVDIYPFALKGASDALIKQFKLVQSDYDFAPWYYASWQVVEDWGQRFASNQVLYEIVNSKPGYHFGHFSDQIRANLGHDKLEKLSFALDGAAYELGFTNTIEPQAYGYNYFLAPFINDWVERGYSLEQLQELVSNALLSNTSWQNHDVSALRATYSHQGDINYKYQLSLACSHYEVNLWANHQPFAAFNYQKELSDNQEVLSKALTSNIVCTVPAQIKEKLPDHDLITYVRPYHVGKDNIHSALRSCGMKRLAISTGLGPGSLPSPSLNMGQLSGHKASTTKARVSLSYPVKVKTKQVVRAKRVEPQLQPELASDSLLDSGFSQELDSSLLPNSVQHSDSSTTVMPPLPPLPSALSGDTSIGDVPQLNEAQDGDDWDFEFEQADSNNLAAKVTSKQSLDDEFNAIINLSAQQSNNLDNAALVEQAFEFDQDLEQELDQDQNSLEQTTASAKSLAPVPASHLTSLEVPNHVQTQEFDGEAYQANKRAALVSTALKPHQEPNKGAFSLEDAHAQAQADGQPHSHGHGQGQGHGLGQEQAPIDGVSSFGFMEGDYADDDMDGVAFDKEKAITEARAKAQQSVLSKDKVDVNNISLEDAAQSNNLFAMPSGYDLSSVLFDDEFFENEVQPPKPTINQLAKRYWRNFKLNVLPEQTLNGQDNHNGQVTSNTLQSSAHEVAPCSGPASELGSGTGAWGASTEHSHDHSKDTGQLFNGQVKAKVATRDDNKGCASASASSSARAGVGAGAAVASAGETFRASSVDTDTTTRAAMGEAWELKDNSIDYVHAYELNNDLGDFVYSKSTSKASLKAKDSALYEGDIRTLSTNQALQLELDAKGLEHGQEASSNGAKIFTHELAFGEANNNLDSQANKQERLKEVYSKQNEALQLLCAIAPHGMGSIDVVKVSSYNNYIEGMGAYLQHIESFIPNLDQRYNIFRLKDYSQDQYTATKAVLKKDCPSNLIMSSRNHILSWTDFILRHLSDPIKTSCATSSLESLVWRALNAQFKRQATFSFIERNYYELIKAVKYSHAQTNYRTVICYCQEQLFSPLEHAAINFITNLLLVVAKSDSADISNIQQSTSSNHKRKQTVYGYERYFSQESAKHSLQTKLNSEQAELNLRKLHLTPEQQAQLSSFQAPQAQKKLHCALPSGQTLAQDSASYDAKHLLNSSADTLAGTCGSASANINAGASASVSARAKASVMASAGGELVKGDGDRATEDATTALAGEHSWDGAGKGQLEGRAELGFGCRSGYAYELDCDKLDRLLPKEQQRYLILKVLQVSAYLNKAHQRLQVGLFDYQKVLTIQDRVVIAALSDDFVVEVLKILQDLIVEQSPLLELSSSYELIALVADITHCCTVESLSNLKIQANKNNELNSVITDKVHTKSYLGVNQVAALTKGCQELIAFLEQQELEEVILLERYYAKMRLYAPSAHERVLKLLSAAYLVHFNHDFEVLLNNLLAAFVSPNIGLESEQSSYDWDTEEILDQDSASNSDIWAEAIDDSSNNDLCEPDEQDETGEQSDESEEGFLFDDNFEEGQKVTDKFLRRLKDPCDYHAQWQDLQEYDFKERAFSKDLKAIMEFIISKIEPQMAYSYSNNMISYFNRTRFKLQQDELNLASILAFRGSMCDRMALLVPPSETLSPSELLDALGCARNEIKVINGDDKLTATLAHSSLQALQLRNELIRRLCKPQA